MCPPPRLNRVNFIKTDSCSYQESLIIDNLSVSFVIELIILITVLLTTQYSSQQFSKYKGKTTEAHPSVHNMCLIRKNILHMSQYGPVLSIIFMSCMPADKKKIARGFC